MAREEKDEHPIIPIELPDVSIETLRRTVRELEAFRKRDELKAELRAKFPVWKQIEIKDYGPPEAVLKSLRKVVSTGYEIEDILAQVKATSPDDFGKTISLVVVSHDDLGISIGATVAQIYARGKEFGLVPCPVISAICLLLQHEFLPPHYFAFCSERYKYKDYFIVTPAIENERLQIWDARDESSSWYNPSLIFALPYK